MAIGTTNFPTSLDTATELIRAVNDARTTISGSTTSGAVTINVTSAAGAPSDGIAVIVAATDDSVREIVSFTGKTATSITGVTRNLESSGAKAWAAGDIVYFDVLTALSRTVLVNSIIALQTKLGIGASTPGAGEVLTASAAGISGWEQPAMVLVASQAFSADSAVSLDNVFTSEFRNYRVVANIDSATAAALLCVRMRAGGVDHTSANYEAFGAFGTSAANTLTGNGATAQTFWNYGTLINGAVDANLVIDLSNPANARKTGGFSQTTYLSTATTTYTHFYRGLGMRVTTPFDGLTLYPASGTITGEIRVYGMKD